MHSLGTSKRINLMKTINPVVRQIVICLGHKKGASRHPVQPVVIIITVGYSYYHSVLL